MSSHDFTARDELAGWSICDPGDGGSIPVDRSGVVILRSAAAETRTLYPPAGIGASLVLAMDVDGGDITVYVKNESGTGVAFDGTNNTMTFNTAGDTLSLFAVQTASGLRWRMITNNGVAVSAV